jgi:hypothetical protein
VEGELWCAMLRQRTCPGGVVCEDVWIRAYRGLYGGVSEDHMWVDFLGVRFLFPRPVEGTRNPRLENGVCGVVFRRVFFPGLRVCGERVWLLSFV